MNLDYKNFAIVCEQGIEDMVSELDASNIFVGEKLRLQADCHVGKGCAVGTCLTYKDKIVPSLVGCDICCRVSAYPIDTDGEQLDLVALDKAIHEKVPAGISVRPKESLMSKLFPYHLLRCWEDIKEKEDRFRKSCGTLGSGNHYIAVERGSESGIYYLMIHTGTRNLGKSVFDYYQAKAIAHRDEIAQSIYGEYDQMVVVAREENRVQDIQGILEERKKLIAALPKDDLCYIEGQDMEDYLWDMELLRKWSYYNHRTIAMEILDALGLTLNQPMSSVHNYVDVNHGIIRKGAISAQKGEYGIIPMNMRDGSLLVVGKGNEDYLWSAPHGAGRIMSRAQAKKELKLEDYQEEMTGIYTTSVSDSTLDEAPDAYKKMEDILPAIAPTVDVVERTIPVYNFKAQ